MSDEEKTWEESGTPGVFFVFGRQRRFLGYGVKGCPRLFSTVAEALAGRHGPEEDRAPDLPAPKPPKHGPRR